MKADANKSNPFPLVPNYKVSNVQFKNAIHLLAHSVGNHKNKKAQFPQTLMVDLLQLGFKNIFVKIHQNF